MSLPSTVAMSGTSSKVASIAAAAPSGYAQAVSIASNGNSRRSATTRRASDAYIATACSAVAPGIDQ